MTQVMLLALVLADTTYRAMPPAGEPTRYEFRSVSELAGARTMRVEHKGVVRVSGDPSVLRMTFESLEVTLALAGEDGGLVEDGFVLGEEAGRSLLDVAHATMTREALEVTISPEGVVRIHGPEFDARLGRGDATGLAVSDVLGPLEPRALEGWLCRVLAPDPGAARARGVGESWAWRVAGPAADGVLTTGVEWAVREEGVIGGTIAVSLDARPGEDGSTPRVMIEESEGRAEARWAGGMPESYTEKRRARVRATLDAGGEPPVSRAVTASIELSLRRQDR